ncbi:hypothetical protein [Microbacterium sp. LWH3-1.2]
MDRDSIEKAADVLDDTLAEIENGELEATAEQRAYLKGALDTLRQLAED